MNVESMKSRQYNILRREDEMQTRQQQETVRATTAPDNNSNQKQVSQILSVVQPVAQVQKKAQDQLNEGYIDVRV